MAGGRWRSEDAAQGREREVSRCCEVSGVETLQFRIPDMAELPSESSSSHSSNGAILSSEACASVIRGVLERPVDTLSAAAAFAEMLKVLRKKGISDTK